MSLFNATLISHHVEEVMKKDQSGTYQALIIKFNSNGEEKTKKAVLSYITQQNPNLLTKLAPLAPGSSILIQTEGQYHQLKDVLLPNEPLPEAITPPKPKNTYMAKASSGGFRSDPKKEASIIRQSCLKVAAELSPKFSVVPAERATQVHELKRLVLMLEKFVSEASTSQSPPVNVAVPMQVIQPQPGQPAGVVLPPVDYIPLNENIPF